MQQLQSSSNPLLQDEVFLQEKPVLIEFSADWCPPCRMLEPILEQVSRKREDVEILKINVDQEQQFSAEQGVKSIPTMVLYKEGIEQARLVGVYPEHIIDTFLDTNIVS